jgi:effector-binding domain-containing protein
MKVIVKSLAGLALIILLESFLTFNTTIAKKPGKKHESSIAAVQEPSVTIEEMNTSEQIIVYVSDSAGSSAEISQKFMKIIPIELGGFLKKNNLQMAGPPCAWYKSNPPPFFFDIGAPVNKMPATTEGRIKVRELPAGKAVVAHYYGPYDKIAKGYTLTMAWIKEHNKTPIAPPYEVYIGDPGIESDPYKVLTNIIFPVK